MLGEHQGTARGLFRKSWVSAETPSNGSAYMSVNMFLPSCSHTSGSSGARLGGVWCESIDELRELGVLAEGGGIIAVWLEWVFMLFMKLPLRAISGMMLSLTAFASEAYLPIRGAGNCEAICQTAFFECDGRTHGAKRQT
jgi:hypothetical protein